MRIRAPAERFIEAVVCDMCGLDQSFGDRLYSNEYPLLGKVDLHKYCMRKMEWNFRGALGLNMRNVS